MYIFRFSNHFYNIPYLYKDYEFIFRVNSKFIIFAKTL